MFVNQYLFIRSGVTCYIIGKYFVFINFYWVSYFNSTYGSVFLKSRLCLFYDFFIDAVFNGFITFYHTLMLLIYSMFDAVYVL